MLPRRRFRARQRPPRWSSRSARPGRAERPNEAAGTVDGAAVMQRPFNCGGRRTEMIEIVGPDVDHPGAERHVQHGEFAHVVLRDVLLGQGAAVGADRRDEIPSPAAGGQCLRAEIQVIVQRVGQTLVVQGLTAGQVPAAAAAVRLGVHRDAVTQHHRGGDVRQQLRMGEWERRAVRGQTSCGPDDLAPRQSPERVVQGRHPARRAGHRDARTADRVGHLHVAEGDPDRPGRLPARCRRGPGTATKKSRQ